MNDKVINVALLGAGTIGSGVLDVLKRNAEDIKSKVGACIKVKTVMETRADVAEVLKQEYSVTQNIEDILNDKDIQIVVELIGREEPAHTFIAQALRHKKHVVTANKDVIAKFGEELFALAQANNVDLLFEASVGGGIPIIRPLKQCLAANKIQKVMGIVNGTTNYMLTKMSADKLDFPVVLKEAQEKGYAESDPTADVGGFDAGRKICILASIAFNTRFSLDDVSIEGITKITSHDIEYANEIGYVIKLLAIAQSYEGKGINLRVHPTFLPKTHPLANVHDVFNAIFISGDAVDDVMFYGRGAGKYPTASAVCADIVDVARDIVHEHANRIACTCYDHKPLCKIEDVEFPFYIRLLVADRPGALSAISAAFGSQQVSLRTVVQKRKINQDAELVLVTYKVQESNMRMAIQTLEVMPIVTEVCSVIRVESDDNEQ